jgi:hypothetical protein
MRREGAFTLVELLVSIGIVVVLAAILTGAGWRAHQSSSLAVSANNLRQLAAGSVAYLGDNNYTFWKYREWIPNEGVRWWFGLEPIESFGAGEGNRFFDEEGGPLGAYLPASIRPDPSFSFTGKAFKPKFAFGYLGVAYNVHLAHDSFLSWAGWMGYGEPARYWQLDDPTSTVVFATSAQVNTFQSPASSSNPMIEEFYGIDEREVTIHGRHNGRAMVVYATGNAGFLEIDPATLDPRAPEANIGRFAPSGSMKYLK